MRIHSVPDEQGGRDAGGSESRRTGGGSEGRSEAGAMHLAAHRDLLRVFHGGQPFAARAKQATPLPASRKREIQRRMLDGTYVSAEVVDQVARAIVADRAL